MQPALCLLQRRIMRKRAETVRDATLISTLAVVLTFGSSQVAVGQTCLRGQPEPGCAGFIVLEFTGAIRLNEKAGATDQNAAFVYWSGGYLQNLDRESALGAAFKITADSDGHRYGPVLRYRRWVNQTFSISLAQALRWRQRQFHDIEIPESYSGPRFQLWRSNRSCAWCGWTPPSRRRDAVARPGGRPVRHLARPSGDARAWRADGGDLVTAASSRVRRCHRFQDNTPNASELYTP